LAGLALLVRGRAPSPASLSHAEATAPAPAHAPTVPVLGASPLPGSKPEVRAVGTPAPVGVSPPAGVSPVASFAGGFGQSPPRTTGPALATALAAEMTPAFGRYTLLERIGEGGMSEVFRAKLSGAESFTKLVAIKRLKPHLALNPDAVNQFIDEARLGSVLAHSNIASVSDFGRVGD